MKASFPIKSANYINLAILAIANVSQLQMSFGPVLLITA